MLESNKGTGALDINCCDPLGRTALLMAIDNENLEIIEMLIDNKVKSVFYYHLLYWYNKKIVRFLKRQHFNVDLIINYFQVETRDALLHAIDEEYVEAVEVLLENEEMKHKEGELHVCYEYNFR